jgi:hypothetical protein
VGPRPWRLPGAINASTTTGIRARSAVSSDAGLGVEVAYVSERYGGSQPASSSTTVANNAPPPIRPVTGLPFPAHLSRRARTDRDQPSSPPPCGDAMVKAQPRSDPGRCSADRSSPPATTHARRETRSSSIPGMARAGQLKEGRRS